MRRVRSQGVRRLSSDKQRQLAARQLLWRATGDRTQLAEAKRLLDEMLSLSSDEDRASALANLRVNREIVAAAKEAGL